MRVFAIGNLCLLALFCLTTQSEASIQVQLADPYASCPTQISSLDVGLASDEAVDSGFAGPICACDVMNRVTSAELSCFSSGLRLPISCGDLLGIAGLDQQSGPSTLAIWSLIGLCCGGGSFWRERKAAFETQRDLNLNRRRIERRSPRAPWSERARAAILQIVSRGCTR